jgi:hypothetical protein
MADERPFAAVKRRVSGREQRSRGAGERRMTQDDEEEARPCPDCSTR